MTTTFTFIDRGLRLNGPQHRPRGPRDPHKRPHSPADDATAMCHERTFHHRSRPRPLERSPPLYFRRSGCLLRAVPRLQRVTVTSRASHWCIYCILGGRTLPAQLVLTRAKGFVRRPRAAENHRVCLRHCDGVIDICAEKTRPK